MFRHSTDAGIFRDSLGKISVHHFSPHSTAATLAGCVAKNLGIFFHQLATFSHLQAANLALKKLRTILLF